ncbi:MAG: hypothetical protein U0324_22290 [Polyangiales bacterium]
MRPALAALPLAVALAATPAAALERQLQLTGRAGFSYASGTHGAPGLAVDAQAAYGLNDAFSLYANGSYTLAFPDPGATRSPRHGAGLSVGVVYAFDYLRVVPYVGLGARADVFFAPDAIWWTPSVEGRLGVSWLLRRGLALDLQAAYAYPFLDNDRLGNIVTVTAGASWSFDP